MNSTIKVSVTFSFKGETYSPSAVIELDKFIQSYESNEGFYLVLARENQIDTYSYLYEVMQAAELAFAESTGLAGDCMDDNGQLDLSKFSALNLEYQVLQQLSGIASEHLDLHDLEQDETVKQALLQAYELGRKHNA